jgi:acetylornithine/succinyldiaminopimelate/putrescine aminotransferase
LKETLVGLDSIRNCGYLTVFNKKWIKWSPGKPLLIRSIEYMYKDFQQYVGQTSPKPLGLEVSAAKGVYIFDKNGKKYLDFTSGICVSALGHGDPYVIRATQEQAASYMHTDVYGEHVQSPQVNLAKLLVDNLPDHLYNVFYTNSGAEAVEGAMKLAKKVTGRYDVVAARGSYHGSTHGAQSLMSDEYYGLTYRPFLPGIKWIEFNNIDSLEVITEETACVIIEPVQAATGVLLPEPIFFQKLKNKCKKVGALLVLDEIQCGLGRTGSLWAFEQLGVEPDILCLAKALGGGMPIGAFIAKREHMLQLARKPVLGYISTFGGHPVCCAAGYAFLSKLLERNFIKDVSDKGRLIHDLLIEHPMVEEIRFIGLMLGIQLDRNIDVRGFIASAKEQGLLLEGFLMNHHAVRIAPPYTITEEQIRKGCEIFKRVLNLI